MVRGERGLEPDRPNETALDWISALYWKGVINEGMFDMRVTYTEHGLGVGETSNPEPTRSSALGKVRVHRSRLGGDVNPGLLWV